jgi:crossover junction endodeoxyribonuclease RuvC
MIILGIDHGIARTGYGVLKKLEGNKLACLGFGCIETQAGLEHSARLSQIREALRRLIEKYHPDRGAVEQLFFAKNIKTALSVAHARGVVLEALHTHGVLVQEYTPLQVKQATTGYGRAEKLQVQKMVQILLALRAIPKPDDAADALAVAICCANTIREINI